MRNEEIIEQANAIVREERERMKKLLLSQPVQLLSPPLPARTVLAHVHPSRPEDAATRLSFDLFNRALLESASYRPPEVTEAPPAPARLQPKPPRREGPKAEALEALLECTCRFLGRACWVCGNSARLGRSTDERPVDIRKALREIDWRRRVGLPQEADQDSTLKFWRRALDIKTPLYVFCVLHKKKARDRLNKPPGSAR